MSLTGEILWSWRHGWGRGLQRQIASGAGEERALGWLMLATVLLIIARMPGSFRTLEANPATAENLPVALVMSGIFMLFLAPLSFYALAALGHFLARALGAGGPFLNARLGLFWALLCLAPVALLAAIIGNLAGPGFDKPLQYLVLFAFLLIWTDTMTVAESLTSRLRTGLALGAIGVILSLLVGMLPQG